MTTGLNATFAVLAGTGNEAAVEVLVAALDAPQREIQSRALTALLDRWSAAGQRAVLSRWQLLDDELKTIVGQRPGHLHDALREAVLGGDPQQFAVACDALLWTKEYDLLAALLTAAEDRTNPLADEAARTLLALADLFYEELHSPENERLRRDPSAIHRHLLEHLRAAVERFDLHRRREVLAAWLTLADRDDPLLKQILSNPHDKLYLTLLEVLSATERPSIVRLLLSFVDDPHAPHAALAALAHRTDEACVRPWLRKVGHDVCAVTKANLRRIEAVAWLRDDLGRLLALSDGEQQAAARLALASGMKRLAVFDVLRFLLSYGAVGARRAAAAALAEFKGVDANLVAMQALGDSDPEVQVHILKQLRERGIPSAMTRLLDAMESPHANVREAAQQCLAEFSCRRFIAAFDLLSPEVRASTGQLVKRVDPDTCASIREELAAQGRTRRFRALQIIGCADLATELESELIQLLSDEDHFVRIEAAQLLAACDSAPTRQALRGALLDRNPGVQEAAETSLAQLSRAPAAVTEEVL